MQLSVQGSLLSLAQLLSAVTRPITELPCSCLGRLEKEKGCPTVAGLDRKSTRLNSSH